MEKILHITSGDICGDSLAKSGVAGEVFVWHDILYDGPRKPGWPDDTMLNTRAQFIEDATGEGLGKELVLNTLRNQYDKLSAAGEYENIVLWFDACLFDQSMLCHILNCLHMKEIKNVELLCIDSFPGIVPFNGLGQLHPSQFLSVYHKRRPVTEEQFLFAEKVDRAFALQDIDAFLRISNETDAPLPWVPAAVARWIKEYPDEATGLGQLEKLALEAIRGGKHTSREIFTAVAEMDTHPQFWGDTTLWAKINSLALKNPPLVAIDGPETLLPQWETKTDINLFRITALKNNNVKWGRLI